jgi:hypothetical protein
MDEIKNHQKEKKRRMTNESDRIHNPGVQSLSMK